MDDIPANIGQSKVAALEAVGEPLVIQAQQVQERGLDVVNVNGRRDGEAAQLIDFAECLPGADAAASQPHRERCDLMIAADARGCRLLSDGGAAELATPNDKCLVQQTALFEVGEQHSAGSIGLTAHGGQALAEIAVMIPVTVAQMDEPHTSFDQPPSQKAIARERRLCGINSVSSQRRRRLVLEADRFGCRLAYPPGQLVRGIASGRFGVACEPMADRVEFANGIDDLRLVRVGHACRR